MLFSHKDGDSVLSVYNVLDEQPTFDVESYDPGTGEVRGRFEVTFVLEASLFPPGTFSPPDTVRFEVGRFIVPLDDLMQ